MSTFPKTTFATPPKTNDVQRVAILYAVILVVMAVAQLFTFDEFLKLVTSFGLPGGIRSAYFLGSFLVVTEVFAIPFLLRMHLSTAFRWLSMICGWLVPIIWTILTVWIVMHDMGVSNVGFLGTTISLTPGWWAIFISIALGILAAWASWGMWPYVKKVKRVTKQSK